MDMFKALKSQISDDNASDMYAWEIDKDRDGFRNGEPAQDQIPNPTDPNCMAVICLFGEKIGTPLTNEQYDHYLEAIKILKPGDKNKKYRLVHPWIEGAEDSGGFALTGSSFECLAALAENRNRKKQQGEGPHNRPLPVFLRFIGSQDIADENKDPEDAGWGNHEHFKNGNTKYSSDPKASLAWHKQYLAQVKQLRNFLMFIRELGEEVKISSSLEEVTTQFEEFLVSSLGFRATDRKDVFKGLEAYGVDDHDIFFGRYLERKEAIRRFTRQWSDSGKPSFHTVLGSSGSGKSSFLRAGVIGRLLNTTHEYRYRGVVFRPADLYSRKDTDIAQSQQPPDTTKSLRRLFSVCVKLLAGRKTDGQNTKEISRDTELSCFDKKPVKDRPEWTAKRLSKLLKNNDEDKPERLLIGLDQFEEIIDSHTDNRAGSPWNGLIEFIGHAARSTYLGVIVTLQSSRYEQLTEDLVLGPLFSNGTETKLVFPSDDELQHIIKKPFELSNRVKLSDELVTEVIKKIQHLKGEANNESASSLLPLISLFLWQLYNECGLKRYEEHKKNSSEEAAEQFENVVEKGGSDKPAEERQENDRQRGRNTIVLTIRDASQFLDTGNIIANLSKKALIKAKSASGPNWSDDLEVFGGLFRRLVVFSGPDMSLISLPDAEMPEDSAARQLALAMKEHRLLTQSETGRIRLVHEAVLKFWYGSAVGSNNSEKEKSVARTWMDREKKLHEYASSLRSRATQWDEQNRSNEFFKDLGNIDKNNAVLLLADWYDILYDVNVSGSKLADKLLRDFCLELLKVNPEPSKIVTDSHSKRSHLIIASLYDQEETVKTFLKAESESIKIEDKSKRTALFSPCFTGCKPVLKALLDAEAKADDEDKDGWRPVHAAAVKGHLDCLEMLHEKKARFDAGNAPDKISPLHLAAGENHVDIIEFLLKNGTGEKASVINSINSIAETPLHFAARNGSIEAIRFLLQEGAEINAERVYGYTPLHLACTFNQKEAVKVLCDEGANLEAVLENGMTALHLACKEGYSGITQILLNKDACVTAAACNNWSSKNDNTLTVSEAGWLPVHLAVEAGHDQILDLLKQHEEIDFNARTGNGDTPLHIAARKDFKNVIRKLIELGAGPEIRNTFDQTPLQAALATGSFEAARALVKGGADVNARVTDDQTETRSSWSLLHGAAVYGEIETARFLLRNNACVDETNGQGFTPLHLAANYGQQELVDLLISNGADTMKTANQGVMPIHLACHGGYCDVIDTLLAENRQLLEQPANEGVTPLHFAVFGNAVDAVRLLLEKYHTRGCADDNGFTPLHIAAQQGNIEITELLLKHEADINAVARSPQSTPLQAAAEAGQTKLVKILSARAKDLNAQTGTKGPALALAIRNGHFDTALQLVEADASLNQLDKTSGETLAQLFASTLKELKARKGKQG